MQSARIVTRSLAPLLRPYPSRRPHRHALKLLRPYIRFFSSQIIPAAANSLHIPRNAAHKVCTPSDAVSLISSNDTVCVSGFVGQGSPDLLLKALSDRYERECQEALQHGRVLNGDDTGDSKVIGDLTLLFGGGPGDWKTRGLNYLARVPPPGSEDNERLRPLIKRTIGGHYGQTPMLGNLATSNQIEAWTLPMGSISRMIRAQATHSPGHITTIGMGTYVDPTPGVGCGGAANQRALESPFHKELVTKISLGFGPEKEQEMEYLLYKALPIQVAIIRATTADSSGNLSFEHESLLCDQRIIATAARNSGGVVLAQVERLAALRSLPSRSVGVPGAMVDCVCVVDEEDRDYFHPMSFTSKYNPVLTGEVKSPCCDNIPKLSLNERKVIARRASFALKPGKVVNLGIGLPEGVAQVAGEEGSLPYITLTTEPGVFGGLPASGHEFGPATNADAIVEMNAQFDFYDGGGLDQCFLGAAQISPEGDVNVSRMSEAKLTGPGGFIDISQATRNISFLCTFTTKGLAVNIDGKQGKISIQKEGSVKKFVKKVFERTFSGEEAVRRGQKVFYVTERAVFRRTSKHEVLELIEIAPGVDLQKDIFDQMEFEPFVSPDLKVMDRRIFLDGKMNLELFGSLEERVKYREEDHTVFIDLFGISLLSEQDVTWFADSLDEILTPITFQRGPVDVVVNYDGYDLKTGLEEKYMKALEKVEAKHYRNVKRYSGKAFRAAKLNTLAKIKPWNAASVFKEMDEDGDGYLFPEELRRGIRKHFGIKLKPNELQSLCESHVTVHNFTDIVGKCLRMR
mmetsp:Transcript_23666/g.49008  ORF Transcript_23666/g.49008 Transcript_23666/m.49008 type:complete len:800 (-) Transcript_23666:96-2495(-)